MEHDVVIIDDKSALRRGAELHRGPLWPWKLDPEQLRTSPDARLGRLKKLIPA